MSLPYFHSMKTHIIKSTLVESLGFLVLAFDSNNLSVNHSKCVKYVCNFKTVYT